VSFEKKVWDVNVFAIFFVEDHPGHIYVKNIIERGLLGDYIPIVLDILPIRAYWIMERKWKINKKAAMDAIKHFLLHYKIPRFVRIKPSMIVKSFEFARKLNHDVYDCLYLAVAMQYNASAIITTDTDFEKLCKQIGLKYENPVPIDVLKQFKSYK